MNKINLINLKKPLEEGEGSFLITDVYYLGKNHELRVTANGYPKITIVMKGTDKNGKEGMVYQDITKKMKFTIIYLGKAIGLNLWDEKDFSKDIHIAFVLNWKDLIGMSGACEFYNDNYQGRIITKVSRYLPLPKGSLQYAPKLTINKNYDKWESYWHGVEYDRISK